ncbi:MAG: PaaI family thioesterase [Armatimonadetes bacterium]|nr:PaaI family thioesterase [Armatimonadota bacterium]
MQITADDYCFACGHENPYGLRLSGFRMAGERYEFEFTPARHHQGWQGIVHGGIVATVLDEAMTRLLWEQGIKAVTAEIAVRYRKPLPVGTRVKVSAWKVREFSRLVEVAAAVADDKNEYATATGKLMRMDHP